MPFVAKLTLFDDLRYLVLQSEARRKRSGVGRGVREPQHGFETIGICPLFVTLMVRRELIQCCICACIALYSFH